MKQAFFFNKGVKICK